MKEQRSQRLLPALGIGIFDAIIFVSARSFLPSDGWSDLTPREILTLNFCTKTHWSRSLALAASGSGAVLSDPKLKARLADLGGTPLELSPADFGKLVADETEKWAKVIRAAKIRAE
jgi:hypothetical protein